MDIAPKTTKALRAYVLAYPAVLPLAFFLTWVTGRLSLGYWPRPSLDDPKDIAWLDIPYVTTGILLVVGLPIFLVANVGILQLAFINQRQRWRLIPVSILSLGLMAGSIALIRWDPLDVVTWYMD